MDLEIRIVDSNTSRRGPYWIVDNTFKPFLSAQDTKAESFRAAFMRLIGWIADNPHQVPGTNLYIKNSNLDIACVVRFR